MVVSGMLKICLFARAGESFKDYLKPLACVWQRISAILGVKKEGTPLPVMINSESSSSNAINAP